MPTHFRRRKQPGHAVVTGSVAVVSLVFIVVTVLLLVNTGLADVMAGVVSGSYEQAAGVPTEAELRQMEEAYENGEAPVEPDRLLNKPESMRGAWLTAGKDYYTEAGQSGETVKGQLDAAVAKLAQWGFNTVIVPFWADGKPLYASALSAERVTIQNADGSMFDPLAYIQEKAVAGGLCAYGMLDLRSRRADGWDPATAEGAAAMKTLAAEAAAYRYDGFLLSGYGYGGGLDASYAAYMRAAPGTGFEPFAADRVSRAVSGAVAALKEANVNLYIGLLADAVWAAKSADSRGMEVSGARASLTDGRADTLGWLEAGLFDFVMVDNLTAIGDGALPFKTVLSWWAEACEGLSLPLYMNLAADKACTNAAGWKAPSELSAQVVAAGKAEAYTGLAFNSYAALDKNPQNSTTVLLGAFNNTIDDGKIENKLVVNNPGKTSSTVYESVLRLNGSANPNFPLTLNGKEIELTEHGYFSMDIELAVGKNTYKFEHNGDAVTYTIERKIVPLKSAGPTDKIETDGGNIISVSAVAYKGASVYAKLNGKTIAMKAVREVGEDGQSTVDSDYETFRGEYTLPAGLEGKSQNLGKITVYASAKGYSGSKTCAQVVIKALPVKPKEDTPAFDVPIDLKAIDPAAGDGAALADGKIVVVTKDYAESFDGSNSDEVNRPNMAYYPRGTTDVVVKEVFGSSKNGQGGYYLLGNGRRVFKKEAAVYKEHGTLKANVVSAAEVAYKDNGTRITLQMDWRIPYNFVVGGQSYNRADDKYVVSSYTASHVDFIFYYTPAAPAAIDVGGSPMFSRAEWIADKGKNTTTLRLHLRKTGAFYGYSVVWDNEGRLNLYVKDASGVAGGGQPLAGKKIVVDPGHGGTGATGSSGAVHSKIMEKDLVLKYSLTLQRKLESMGAQVIMTRTTDRNPDADRTPQSLSQRNSRARNNYSDAFISVHANSGPASARGSTVFYHNEYAMELAKAVGTATKAAYNKQVPGVYDRSGGGYYYEYFMVTQIHDCPAILVETGFMSNAKELELLQTDKFNDWITDAIVEGLVNYFKDRAVPAGVTAASRRLPDAAGSVVLAPAALLTAPLARRRRRGM